jgi:hypothetical protein
MQIVDDGVGFKPQEAVVAAPGHLGLASIRGRAEMAGGWSNLWSLPGQGTTLDVWLPPDESDHSRFSIDDVEGAVADVVPLPDRAGTSSLGRRTGAVDARVVLSDGRRSREG